MKRPDTEISTQEIALELGLSDLEYDQVCQSLKRKPNFAELGIFSAMFSEHCSYKSSKRFLRRLPTEGDRVLQGPGENAGILDIGHGWAVAFKMESHNHPSFIEPYQGAATGVGGILRDIFTMGARPIASMNSLCFGSPSDKRTGSLVRGVVRGIGDYGNSVGVPTVAGQTVFHQSYNANILVNAFTAGIVRHEEIFRASASGIGNALVYAGAKTGRDGVHGATMASQEFNTEKEPDRPTVQVGDPFTEKLLLEASIEAMRSKLLLGIQDMGAAGLTSSSFEMAHRASSGLKIDLDKIPTRETGMSAYELLLSESQERMLIVTSPDKVDELIACFEKWDLDAVAIGEVTDTKRMVMSKNGETVVDLPIELVVDAPMAERPVQIPSQQKQLWFMDLNRLKSSTLESKIEIHLSDVHFAKPTPIVEQYDSMVGNRTEGGTFDDAATLRIRDIKEAPVRLSFSTDCNPRICYLDPKEGGRRAVAESAINLATRGAKPIGVTDCLNFGSPENPHVMWQFAESIEGIRESCLALKTPVISGNVSFYNNTDGEPIYPTPMVGMVGLSESESSLPHSSFYSTELELALVGPLEGGLGGSLFASNWFKRECGKPSETDLSLVGRTIGFCQEVHRSRVECALHDISDGGLLVAALEMSFHSKRDECGVEIILPVASDVDTVLFGETAGRLLIAFDTNDKTQLETLARRSGLEFRPFGRSTDQGKLEIKQGSAELYTTDLTPLKRSWEERWKSFF